MSIDTYFCFCCLSTNELSPLYSENVDTNYAGMLRDFFNITISLEDYEYDGHICNICIQNLTDICKLKAAIHNILSILQNNGLVHISKENDSITVKKVTQEDDFPEIEEKYVVEHNTKAFTLFEDVVQEDAKKPKTIKQEFDHRLDEKAIDNSASVVLERGSGAGLKKEGEGTRVGQYDVTDDLKCSLCSMVMPNLYTFHAHMNQHYPNHICESCGKGFVTEKRLKRHMPSHRAGQFKCGSCDAEFTNYNTLNSHRQRKHSSVLLYRCPHCQERFRTFARRAAHLADEHKLNTPAYACKICNKKFRISGNLSAHMRNKHLKSRSHACTQCGAAFSSRRELEAHAAGHSGLRPHRCDVCGKRYPRKKSLIVHMRTHTGERRFACDVCGKRFIQKNTLLVHARTHNRVDSKSKELKSKETLTVSVNNTLYTIEC